MKSFLNLKTIGKNATAVVAATVALVSASTARADNWSTVDVASSVYLCNSETRSIALGGWHYVKKVIIQARGGTYQDGTFEVIANGDVKGTVHVPGYDPSYVVTVDETVATIELRHVSGGAVSISDIKAVESDRNVSGGTYGGTGIPTGNSEGSPSAFDYDGTTGLKVVNTGSEIAARAMELVNQLRGFSNYSEEGRYLLPIKKAAARAYAKARARHGLSGDVRNSLIALKAQIEFAAPYIEEYFERDDAYNLATELLSLQEQIDALVQ